VSRDPIPAEPIFECGFCSYHEDDGTLISRCKACAYKRKKWRQGKAIKERKS
jgi:hypothetical protein